MPNLNEHLSANLRRLTEPVQLPRHQPAAEQLRPRSDHHGAIRGANIHHIHRLAESARQSTSLPDGEPGKAIVAADATAVGEEQWTRGKRGRIGPEMFAQDLR